MAELHAHPYAPANDVEVTDRKWSARSTLLFILLTCGGFWGVVVWAVLEWGV